MKIGLLPLYVKLYDDVVPVWRPRLEAFYGEIASRIAAQGIAVETTPFCRLEAEFSAAVAGFEAAGVDAIVTLHMAYSPSLESIKPLAATALPIFVLDTTETLDFSAAQSSDEIGFNHGIHGVMDMCSMLIREGKAFEIVAGHYATSDCIARLCGRLRAYVAAQALKSAKVGLIGGHFAGMGDFRVDYAVMKERFGIDVAIKSAADMRAYYAALTDEEVAAEAALMREKYDFEDNIIPEEFEKSVRSCLATRRCIEAEGLTAFSATFLGMGLETTGLAAMPFLETCQAMARGIGYAGEGDLLTAAFVGAMMQGFPETNFVEIFCPSWHDNTLFLSHMGETNYALIDTKPLVGRVAINYGEGPDYPYVGKARMKGGRAVFANICCTRDDFKLVVSAVEMLDVGTDRMPDQVRGWMKLGCDTATFLENLSREGATHHSMLIYGADIEAMRCFGEQLGLPVAVI